MDPKNYPHINTTCPECKNHEILQDPEHGETYCTKCGLIIQDQSIFRITLILQEEQKRNTLLCDFWRKTNKRGEKK